MSSENRQQLARSWESNADAWTEAVRAGAIPSRRLGTDAAIVDAILERKPRRVLDVGCGEGWLARSLTTRDIQVTGIDASATLIERARAEGGGTFHVCSFSALAGLAPVLEGKYDVVVCNFALLDEDIVPVLRALRSVVEARGALIIQTVHPWTAKGDGEYRDGWRTETFAGFGVGFSEPMPWYFRTLASWMSVLRAGGYQVEELREPTHPETGDPLALLLIARPDD